MPFEFVKVSFQIIKLLLTGWITIHNFWTKLTYGHYEINLVIAGQIVAMYALFSSFFRTRLASLQIGSHFSSVCRPKLYIPSTITTKMNLVLLIFLGWLLPVREVMEHFFKFAILSYFQRSFGYFYEQKET